MNSVAVQKRPLVLPVRHLNYFGAVCGEPSVAVGAAFNSIVMAAVTVVTERRMLAVPERRAAFEAYRQRTSPLIPWWPRRLPTTGSGGDRWPA